MMYGDDTANQLATIFSGSGLDTFGAEEFSGVDSFSYGDDDDAYGDDDDLFALGAEAKANTMLYGAASPQAQQSKAKLKTAVKRKMVKANKFQQLAMARAAGKVPFDTTSERNTLVRREGLPIPPTLIPAGAGGNAGLLAPASFTFAVRPIRSQQINRIAFASGDIATAACVLISVQILGVEQLNGPGGMPCGLYSEVMTEPNLKGATAQAAQDILITVGNTSNQAVVIRGGMFGPDLVRVT